MSQYAKYPSSGSSIPIPVPIADGGTGSTTAAGALTNLGAANNQLSNLVSPTAVNQDLIFPGVGANILLGASPTDIAVTQFGASGLTVGSVSGGSNPGPQILLNAFPNGGNSVPAVVLTSANGTAAIPTASIAGDDLGQHNFYGFDGTSYSPAGLILVQANENWGSTAHSSSMVLTATGDGGGVSLTLNKAQTPAVVGMNFTQVIPSSATTSYHGFQMHPSAIAAFTLPLASDFFAQGIGKSGSAVITRFANYFGTAATQATNNAFLADNSAFTGNYFINSTNANPTKLNGVLQLPSTIATTAGSSVISVTSQLLTTTGGLTTVDWANRQLFDTANNVSVDWQSKILGDTLGNSALNWQTKIAEDNAGNNSINWQSRTLFDSGPNIVFIWNTRSFYDTTASIVAHFDSPGIFNVAQLGVANSAAATIPGTVVKKIEVFDDNGVSLGFLPVYDSIT